MEYEEPMSFSPEGVSDALKQTLISVRKRSRRCREIVDTVLAASSSHALVISKLIEYTGNVAFLRLIEECIEFAAERFAELMVSSSYRIEQPRVLGTAAFIDALVDRFVLCVSRTPELRAQLPIWVETASVCEVGGRELLNLDEIKHEIYLAVTPEHIRERIDQTANYVMREQSKVANHVKRILGSSSILIRADIPCDVARTG